MSMRPGPARSVTRARMYDVIRAPLITEKTTNGSEHSQVTFQVPMDATKPEIKQAVEGLFKVKVKAVNTVTVKGKTQALQGPARRAERLEEGDRLAGRGSQDRRDHGPVGRGKTDGFEDLQTDHAVAAPAGHRRPHGPVEGQAGQGADRGKNKTGGRNNHGHITATTCGGGHKRALRLVDFKRRKFDVAATVERLEYDPNRSAFIALIKYADGELAYILAPQRLKAGDKVVAGERVDIKPGNAMPLANMPVGTIVHNVELKKGRGGQLARSAGTYAQLVGKDAGYAQIRLSSGELRLVPGECLATVGAVSNPDHQNIVIGKAGRKRWLGRRPHVRGVAMNPVDHPHGGGEGRTSGGRHPVTPVGQADQGQEDPQEQGDGQVHHPPPSRDALERDRASGTFRLEGPVRRRAA